MNKWHQNNSKKYINANKPLDTNPDHYQSSFGRHLDPRNSKDYMVHSSYTEGVVIHFIDGTVYKTKAISAKKMTDVFKDILATAEKNDSPSPEWFLLENGTMIHTNNIAWWGPYKFYEHDSYHSEDKRGRS